MSLIEGVGDEVVQFVVAVVIVVIAALAWWSTNARPDRYRTFLLMRPRTREHFGVSLMNHARTRLSMPNRSIQEAAADTSDTRAERLDVGMREPSRVIPVQEMDSIADADMAMMDHDRLHFYRRLDSPGGGLSSSESEGEVQEEQEPASHAQIREMDSIVTAMEADRSTNPFNRPTAETNSAIEIKKNTNKCEKKNDTNQALSNNVNSVEDPSVNSNTDSGDASGALNNVSSTVIVDAQRILIKLKYLNDTLKEVDGSLDELLKDFKMRHFSTELTAQHRVRLIFNGHVLSDDAATLRACGLHDRAVVHCLVHPNRGLPQQRSAADDASAVTTHDILTEGTAQERTWDLENILMTLVSVALTVVWFFRCEYANMFTASASVALFGLTVFYSVAIFGLYLSDSFHFERRRPAAPSAPPAAPSAPPAAPAHD